MELRPKFSEKQISDTSISSHYDVQERLESMHLTLKNFDPKKACSKDNLKSKISCNPMFESFDETSLKDLTESDSEDQKISNLSRQFDNLSLNDFVKDSIKDVINITEDFTKDQSRAIIEAKESFAKQIEKSFSEEERAVEMEMANEKLEKPDSSITFTKILDDHDIDQESFPENFKDNLSSAEDKIQEKPKSILLKKSKLSSQSCNDLDKSTCSSFSGSSLPMAKSKRPSRPSSSCCTSRKSFYSLVPSSGYNPQLKTSFLQAKRSRSVVTPTKRKFESEQSSKSSSKSCLLDTPKFTSKSAIPILIHETRPKSPARGPLTLKSGDPLNFRENIPSKDCGDSIRDSKLEGSKAIKEGLNVEIPKLNQ